MEEDKKIYTVAEANEKIMELKLDYILKLGQYEMIEKICKKMADSGDDVLREWCNNQKYEALSDIYAKYKRLAEFIMICKDTQIKYLLAEKSGDNMAENADK